VEIIDFLKELYSLNCKFENGELDINSFRVKKLNLIKSILDILNSEGYDGIKLEGFMDVLNKDLVFLGSYENSDKLVEKDFLKVENG